MSDNKITNIFKSEKTIKIPVYSSIKQVNGEVVGELEGFEELPVELLLTDKIKH